MKKIIVNTPDYILDLSDTDTANYAQEDIVLVVDEKIKNIYLPPMSKIKGNPNIYIWVDSSEDIEATLHLTGGDFVPVTTLVYPTGKISAIPFNIVQSLSQVVLMFGLKPIINGAWALSTEKYGG